jgi:hypothetical protein
MIAPQLYVTTGNYAQLPALQQPRQKSGFAEIIVFQ